ncbi:MAG: hypothetical protein ACT4QG_01540 [Sporichthyaceae bacterium]
MNSHVAVLGAHGGAGARTVVEMLRIGGVPAVDLELGEHLPAGSVPALVTRSTAAGMKAAAELLAQWHPEVALPWLIVVADVPAPPPPPVRYRLRVVRGMARATVDVPFLWPLRAVDSTEEVAGVKPVARAIARLAAAFTSPRDPNAVAGYATVGAQYDPNRGAQA